MPALASQAKNRNTIVGDLLALRAVSQWDLLSMPSTAPFGGCLWRGALELPPFGGLSGPVVTLEPRI